MKSVWIVTYEADLFNEELYQQCLVLLDEDNVAKIKRFYHRADACRGLIGKLMIRLLLKERGINLRDMAFSKTDAGKPYVTNNLEKSLAYNLTHDNRLIAIVYGECSYHPPAFHLGIDVMKVQIPTRETYRSFMDTFSDQLTRSENYLIDNAPNEEEGLQLFFWMWTLKEAYTKALGLGLGFDFKRVDFDPISNVVGIDGKALEGWTFYRFQVDNVDESLYLGVTAEYTGGKDSIVHTTVSPGDVDWIKMENAEDMAPRVVNILSRE